MIDKLNSVIELNAEKAESLRTFSGVKLLHIKKQVELLLSHIGDIEIFSEYTKHDISHIDEIISISFCLPLTSCMILSVKSNSVTL